MSLVLQIQVFSPKTKNWTLDLIMTNFRESPALLQLILRRT